ncbi:MAG: ECF transporter S component [Clostridiaceae bacterium]|jgi:uncharacterized membrane protein|nr:ECF transporter S component [Clostridiaceae bacterium]
MKNFFKSKTKYIVFTSLFTALTLVATIAIHMPIPAVNGYMNFGDAVILVCAALFGGIPALIAGAIGAALGDLILGYPQWIPVTIVAKGLEGLIAGFFLQRVFKLKASNSFKILLGVTAIVVGAAIMPVVYFFAAWITSGVGGAAVALVSDLIQAAVAVAVAVVLVFVVDLPKILTRISSRIMAPRSPAQQQGAEGANSEVKVEVNADTGSEVNADENAALATDAAEVVEGAEDNAEIGDEVSTDTDTAEVPPDDSI